jgi:tripartite-type tricarboxylate transporter receptor subunit TctC
VPKGTPRDIVAKLNGALVSTLADPALRQKLVELSQEIFAREQLTPEALLVFHKAEIE